MSFQTARGHLLIVDDDELVREYLCERLREAGYSCAVAANGLEAIAALREQATPDVILLDVNMPGLDGMEFLRLAQNHVGTRFGVIVMSGVAGPRLKEQAIRYGAFTLLPKPLDFDKLLRLIAIQQELARTRSALRG
jgi:CheY-like chemotaxis protein